MLLGSLLAPFNASLATRLGGKPRLASAITTLGVVLLILLPELALALELALERELAILRADLDKKNSELGAMDRLREGLERELTAARESLGKAGRGGLFRR